MPFRRDTVCWAAVLLMGCLGSRLSADESVEELTVDAGDHRLAGSLYKPQSEQPTPAVVFVHGAGPAVRSDGYQELARHFAQRGVAALIYDKRGCGASTGDWTRAGLYDLAVDALAWVRMLRGRPDINPTQVGLWGLSQGASIVPIAAGRSEEVAFVIAVGGCLDFEEQMRYFRANVFRGRGLPPAALDIANKVFLIQVDFGNRVRDGRLPAPQSLRDTCRFEFDLDQAAVWRQVRQPILAIYGARDRQVPLAENIARLSNVVEQSGQRDFTLIIYPGASHSVGKTQTGELGEEWTGYVPEYLEGMTDWVLERASGVKRRRALPQEVPVSDPEPFTAARYDGLRWYGNAPVQVLQLLVFAVVFLGGVSVGTIAMVRRRHDQAPMVTRLGEWRPRVATAVSVLNLALLAGLVALARGLANAWEPSYPAALNWLPLAGSLSAGLTLMMLAMLLAGWRAMTSRRKRIAWGLLAACAITFVPFLLYWNLLGLSLS